MLQGRRQDRSGGRGVFLVLALLAVILKLSAPTGFMPSLTADDGFAIVICHGDGSAPQTATFAGLVKPGDDGGSGDRSQKDTTCSFAGLGSIALSPPPPLMATRGEFYFTPPAPPPLPRDLSPGRGLAAPPPPAQAPPRNTI